MTPVGLAEGYVSTFRGCGGVRIVLQRLTALNRSGLIRRLWVLTALLEQ